MTAPPRWPAFADAFATPPPQRDAMDEEVERARAPFVRPELPYVGSEPPATDDAEARRVFGCPSCTSHLPSPTPELLLPDRAGRWPRDDGWLFEDDEGVATADTSGTWDAGMIPAARGPEPCAPLPWYECEGRAGVFALDRDFGPRRGWRDLRPTLEGLSVSRRVRGCERDFVAAIWSVLRDNVDLVQWAACLAGLDREQRQCLEERLTTTNEVVVVRHEVQECLTPNGKAWGMKHGRGAITICFLPGSPAGEAMEVYCGCPGTDRALCAALAMSCTLLHELAHVCGESHDNEAGALPRKCQPVYLLQQSFAWALFQRYPAAARGRCCTPWATTVPGSGVGGLSHLSDGCSCPPARLDAPFDVPAVRGGEVSLWPPS